MRPLPVPGRGVGLFGAKLSAAASWQETMPNPSIMRDGKDFYMTHSAFNYNPGFLIWHSQDLVNWEPVCRVTTKQIVDAWAPDLLKHDGKYYLYFPSRGKIYVCTSDRVEGPWSDPVEVKGAVGIDPGHVVATDGRRYLFTNNGRMAPLNDSGTALTDTMRIVHKGWDIPKQWVTEGKYPEKYLESPKLLHHNGYYYLTSAEGGTARSGHKPYGCDGSLKEPRRPVGGVAI